MKISHEVLAQVNEHVEILLEENRDDINGAYMNSGESFSVNIKALFKPKGPGIAISTSISFTKEKVSGSMISYMDDSQENLALPKKDAK